MFYIFIGSTTTYYSICNNENENDNKTPINSGLKGLKRLGQLYAGIYNFILSNCNYYM